MSVKMSGKLLGKTNTEIIHEPSGTVFKTAAPVDNGGDGSSFSPTDLCAASLGACATTIMSLYASKNSIPLNGIRFQIIKEMSASPRKISCITTQFFIESNCSNEDFNRLVAAGKTCPVRLTLSDDVKIIEEYLRS